MIVDSELERMRKEAMIAQLTLLSGGTEELL
jgi:hypothetical protein